jgi:hypothetical protein
MGCWERNIRYLKGIEDDIDRLIIFFDFFYVGLLFILEWK